MILNSGFLTIQINWNYKSIFQIKIFMEICEKNWNVREL